MIAYLQIHSYRYASKTVQRFVKFVCHFFTPHFYGLCGKCQDTEMWHFLPNAAVIRRTCHIFTAKGAAIWQKAKDCGVLQDGALRCSHQSAVLLPSKCGAFAIKVRHFWRQKATRFRPFFQVLPRRVCCILFDTYCM